MLIANPIYDVTFKRLLENDRTAKFLVGTILGCKIITLEPGNPEYVDESVNVPPELTIFRMDFVATIVTEDEGEKRVIIELQKAKSLGDVYRFKRYLGHEYRRTELPIISIYILGFNLSVESPAFAAFPDYRDLMTNEPLNVKENFVEQLTHRAYFIQAGRIKPGLNTKLEKLLSVFEQSNFIGDGMRTKDYPLKTDDPEIEEMLKVLHYVVADKEAQEDLDREEEVLLTVEGIFGETNRELARRDAVIAEQAAALADKDAALADKDAALAAALAEIEKLRGET